MDKKIKISYSGVVLDVKSHEELRALYFDVLREEISDWKLIAHHMTICLGALLDEKKKLLGTRIRLKATHYAADANAFAVKVLDDGLSVNKIPHVTVAINQTNGGKPKDSNNLRGWIRLWPQLTLFGKVMEIV